MRTGLNATDAPEPEKAFLLQQYRRQWRLLAMHRERRSSEAHSAGTRYGIGAGEGGGVSGRTCMNASQNVAKASDSTTIGMPARAYSPKRSSAPIRSARSAISTLVRLPVSIRLPARVDSSASA